VQRRGLRQVRQRRDGGNRGPPYRGARNLLTWVLAHFAKVNGDFLRTHGHGIEQLSPRELCDVAYSSIVADMERHYYALVAAGAKWEDVSDPLGDDIQRFEERIGLRDDPEAIALAMHRQFLKDQGKEWDDTPVGAGTGQWWEQDTEFTSMSDLDQASKRRQAVEKNRGLFAKNKAPADKEVL
jgi:hypothetical protein